MQSMVILFLCFTFSVVPVLLQDEMSIFLSLYIIKLLSTLSLNFHFNTKIKVVFIYINCQIIFYKGCFLNLMPCI